MKNRPIQFTNNKILELAKMYSQTSNSNFL